MVFPGNETLSRGVRGVSRAMNGVFALRISTNGPVRKSVARNSPTAASISLRANQGMSLAIERSFEVWSNMMGRVMPLFDG